MKKVTAAALSILIVGTVLAVFLYHNFNNNTDNIDLTKAHEQLDKIQLEHWKNHRNFC